MKNALRIYGLAALFLLLLCSSCRKEKDDEYDREYDAVAKLESAEDSDFSMT